MFHYAVALGSLAAALVLGGCGSTPSSAPDPAQEATVTKSAGPTERPDERRGVAADALQDLSRRLGVQTSEISVVSVEEVTWRDGSIGCPRPGMMYPQALTDGSRVVLDTGGRQYEYHAGGRRSAFLCENPEPPADR
jgi:hypothetical protein